METSKKIDYRFKLLYAIGIIMVVSEHCDGGSISLFRTWFPYNGVHLALFVFCSGYFYKSKAESDVVGYFLKKLRTLIVPLYIYTLVYGIIVKISKLYGFGIGEDLSLYNVLVAPITDGHQFVYNMGGWFIAPLFMLEIFNVVIRKLLRLIKSDMSEWVFFVISVGLGILGNWLAILGYRTGGWIVLDRMLYFLPFYGLGILYKSKLESVDKRIPSFYYLAAVFALKFLFVFYFGHDLIYTPSWCDNFTEGPVMPVVVGFLGIALWMRIANILGPVIGRSKWINLIADSTYSIMMNQFAAFMLVKAVYWFLSTIDRLGNVFDDFSVYVFKNDIWWFYTPKGLNLCLIFYVIAGIAVPVLIQKIVDKVSSIQGFGMQYGGSAVRQGVKENRPR